MKQAINLILFLILLSVIAAMLFMPLAHATGQADPVPSVANSTASAKASSQSSSALDLSLMNNPVQSMRGGNSYSFVGGSAAPLPAGLCAMNDSDHWSFFFITRSTSKVRTDMECLDKVLSMLRDTAPKPVVVNYLQPDPKPTPAALTSHNKDAPAPLACVAKPKPAAPKKHVKAPKACK